MDAHPVLKSGTGLHVISPISTIVLKTKEQLELQVRLKPLMHTLEIYEEVSRKTVSEIRQPSKKKYHKPSFSLIKNYFV